jgi:hypothetical protein
MTATDHKHHRDTVRKPIGDAGWPDPRSNGAPTSQREPQPLTDAERRADAARAERARKLSRERIDGALAVACDEHQTEPGGYCFPAARGLCQARYAQGAAAAAASAAAHPRLTPWVPDTLATFANAIRNAQHDARWREGSEAHQQRVAARETGVQR